MSTATAIWAHRDQRHGMRWSRWRWHRNQRGEPAAAPGSQRGKSSPPARVLTIMPSPHVIRTTVRNRVEEAVFPRCEPERSARRADVAVGGRRLSEPRTAALGSQRGQSNPCAGQIRPAPHRLKNISSTTLSLCDRGLAGDMPRQRTLRAARRTRQTGNREAQGRVRRRSRTCACCNQLPEPRFPAPSSGSPSGMFRPTFGT
jgi:hypothetical protein